MINFYRQERQLLNDSKIFDRRKGLYIDEVVIRDDLHTVVVLSPVIQSATP